MGILSIILINNKKSLPRPIVHSVVTDTEP